jgi:carbonic anhydrase
MGPKRIHKTTTIGIRKEDKEESGPTKERDGTWRIKTNYKLNKLIKNKTVINYIKSQRLGWFGHVYRIPDERMVKKGV